jgi:hypothetical protein
MPQITTGAVFSINLDGTLYGQQILLTTHWQVVTVTPEISFDDDELFTELNTIIDGVAGIATQYTSCACPNLMGIKQVSQVLHPARFIRRVDTLIHDAGVVEGDSLPPNVSAAITLRTDTAGRDQMGTKHIAGMPPDFTANGLITVAGMGAYEGLATALITPMTATVDGSAVVCAPVIYRRTAPAESPILSNYIIGDTSRVERRRTVRLGS